MNKQTIVLIHGLFVNNEGWSGWKNYLEGQGFDVYAPAYPGHAGNPAALRKTIHPDLTKTGLKDVYDYIAQFIDNLPVKPIVIGHSMGGFLMQKLLEDDKAIAGVSLDGAPPKDVMIPFATLKKNWPAVNFFKSNSKPYLGTREWYHDGFYNNFSRADSDKEFDKWAVPESRNIVKDLAFNGFAAVDDKKVHAPMLFVSGTKDAFFSPDFTQKIVKKYATGNHVTELKVFNDRSHAIYHESGWEEVATFVAQWINQNVK